MELDFLTRVAIEAAKAGAQTAHQGFGKKKAIQTKSSAIDLVTEFDRKSQEAIVGVLQAQCPDHGLLGEENLDATTDSDYLWVLDPIDGTTNYAHHSPIYSVSIGLVHHGRPLVGVVYAPELNELYVAAKGQGATLNGQSIGISHNAALSESVLGTGFAYDLTLIDRNLVHFERFVRRSRAIRRLGSAALDLCWVAAGRFDGYWELALNAWDVCAGWLIVTEAGGRVTDFSGDEYKLFANTLVCSNGLIHEQMLAVLREA